MKSQILLIAVVLLITFLVGSCSKEKQHVGLFPVEQNGRCGYIDKTGKLVISPQFDSCYEFHEGLAAVIIGQKLGFIDTDGKLAINPQFDAVTAEDFRFSEGLAVVQVDSNVGEGDFGKYGYIDKLGKFVITPQYRDAKPFADGFALVKSRSGQTSFIDHAGERAFETDNAYFFKNSFSDGLVVFSNGPKSGFIDKAGKVVFMANEITIDDFAEGLASAMQNRDNDTNKCGYIDKTGKYVIPPQFGQCGKFSEGLGAVTFSNGKQGFVNSSGQVVISAQFDVNPGSLFSDGLASVRIGDKWGYIDPSGKFEINPQFDGAFRFQAGIAKVFLGIGTDTKSGYIDKGGKFIWSPSK